MKKNLLYAALILFGLNGLHAFNPFTAMGNVVRGESSCQPSLVDKLAKGLPAFQASRNKTLTGAALKNRQAFEKDIAMLHRCTGDDPNRDQQVVLGEKLRKNHPKLTEKVSSVCSQNPQFKKVFPNQCAIAGKAKSSIDRTKGIQTNSPNARGNSQGTKAPNGRKARRGSGGNPNNGMYNQPPAYGYAPPPPAYGYAPQVDPTQQYQQMMPPPAYPAPYAPPPAYGYAPQVDPMQQYQQMMPPPPAYPAPYAPPPAYGYAPQVDPMQQYQ
ncbi:MAG: hypothetical protein NT128_07260, partial [Proteobacteria bacterium]|nr:hypothetical protein [Pseudomonadota bacterium]